MGENLPRSLFRYIREIDIIILGIGILLFVSGEIDNGSFSHRLYAHKQFIWVDFALFASIYVFLTYDWIAYSVLVTKWPYKITGPGLIRLYIDLFQLFTKGLLVVLAAQEITAWHLLLISILFFLWHAIVLLWHWRLQRDHKDVSALGWDHAVFLVLYGVYAAVTYYLARRWNWQTIDETRYILTIVLCALIVAISLVRQSRILAPANVAAAANTSALAEFDEKAAQLRGILEANQAAQEKIGELDNFVLQTQQTIADLKDRLTRSMPPPAAGEH